MRTKYSGSRRGAQDLMIERMVAAGWPEDEARARVMGAVARDSRPGRMTGRFIRSAAEAAGDFTEDQWLAIVERYGRCLRCEATDRPLVPDHIVPLWRGGAHTADNIQPLCGPCNLWKGTRSIDYRVGYRTTATPVAEGV